MTPRAGKASPKQVQVLYAIEHRKENTTAAIHEFRAFGLKTAGKAAEKQRATYEVLLTCSRYEWVERAVADEAARAASPNDGSGVEWFITAAGREALERGHAALQERKGETVGTTTEEPPATKPAWGGGKKTDDEDLKTLDGDGDDGSHEEAVSDKDVEVQEPDDEPSAGVHHTTEGEQLTFTLEIGGALPTSSVLKLGAKQITFKDREFAKGDVLPFEGELRIVEVGARDKKQGTQRFQVAVVDRITIGADDAGS